MRRSLTITTCRVAAADRPEYLATIAALAPRHAERGCHLWLFEREGEPGLFVEFRESSEPDEPRGDGTDDGLEATLEDRLAALGGDRHGAGERWIGINLTREEEGKEQN